MLYKEKPQQTWKHIANEKRSILEYSTHERITDLSDNLKIHNSDAKSRRTGASKTKTNRVNTISSNNQNKKKCSGESKMQKKNLNINGMKLLRTANGNVQTRPRIRLTGN